MLGKCFVFSLRSNSVASKNGSFVVVCRSAGERWGATCVFDACVQILLLLLFARYYFLPPPLLFHQAVNCYHCDKIVVRLLIEHATGYLLCEVVVCN